ncbi:MAG: SCO1664 family protein [Anaerolineae bacterium]|nr:SCO1664 family protein [Thermoflexales bacterium]MDW8408182.1 SCO1664 family protein [Anaerolineae bacterium]
MGEKRSFSTEQVLQRLHAGRLESLGLLPWSSNYTFLVKVTPEDSGPSEDEELLAVYKPRRGEAPLWDFPDGTLCLRELAAYLVDAALGWGLIPPTVLRNGPHGFGSVQLFIENDPSQHFFTFRENPANCETLKRLALFDLITNNADRKSGHCLLDKNGRIWAIDHGITFNADYKLRTVIWDFAGQPIPQHLLDDLRRLREEIEPHQPLGKVLRDLLTEAEVAAFARRIDGLLKIKTFPGPSRSQRSIPWPPV